MKLLLPFARTRLETALNDLIDAHTTQFYFAPLLEAQFLPLREPILPEFLVLTSQNGVRSVQAQPWFGPPWRDLPSYGVGPKTCARARAAGFRVVVQADPPASNLVPHLPSGQGIWFSGQEVAADLTQTHAGLRRVPAYTMVLNTAVAAKVQQALAVGEIDAALFTSARLARELAALCQGATCTLPHLAVMSARLADLASALFPKSNLEIMATLDAAVRWHLSTLGLDPSCR